MNTTADAESDAPPSSDEPVRSSAAPDTTSHGAARTITLTADHGALSHDETERLRAAITAAAEHLNLAGDIRFRAVHDDAMRAAHHAALKLDTTTDVLTFDLRDDTADSRLDVDVLICADEARRRAAERPHDAVAELTLYAVHAVLHCTGFDDHTDHDAARMHQREDQVLTAIGIGPVYATQPTTDTTQ